MQEASSLSTAHREVGMEDSVVATGRTRRAGAGDSRDNGSAAAILATAVEVLAREGMHRTTAEQIADKAGVSQGLVNYRFGGRQQLLHSALAAAMATPAPGPGASGPIDELAVGLPLPGGTRWRLRADALCAAVFDQHVRDATLADTVGWADRVATRLGDTPNAHLSARVLTAVVDGLRQRVTSGLMGPDEAEALLRKTLNRAESR